MKQSQAPSRLPAQCRAGQLLTGENLDAPANNLHIDIRDVSRKQQKISGNCKSLAIIGKPQASARQLLVNLSEGCNLAASCAVQQVAEDQR